MVTCGQGGDLLSNFSLSGGTCSCHSTWDLTTTSSGDLALTKDDFENRRQRLLQWLATPKGERINPAIGCCLHDYMHAKITGQVHRELELSVGSDLKSVFPDLTIKNISVQDISDLEGGNRTILMGISLGTDDLQFVANFNDLTELNDSINMLLYYGGAEFGGV